MPHHQPQLERQLQHAKSALAARTKKLEESGIDAKDRKRDTRWRKLNSNCSSITARIKAAKAVVTLDEEVKQRKADKAAADNTAIAEQPPKKEKKKKSDKVKGKAEQKKAVKKAVKKKAKKK